MWGNWVRHSRGYYSTILHEIKIRKYPKSIVLYCSIGHVLWIRLKFFSGIYWKKYGLRYTTLQDLAKICLHFTNGATTITNNSNKTCHFCHFVTEAHQFYGAFKRWLKKTDKALNWPLLTTDVLTVLTDDMFESK